MNGSPATSQVIGESRTVVPDRAGGFFFGSFDHNKIYRIGIGSTGNLFVAHYFNGSIRQIDSGGIITTIAGAGREASAKKVGRRRPLFSPGQLVSCWTWPGVSSSQSATTTEYAKSHSHNRRRPFLFPTGVACLQEALGLLQRLWSAVRAFSQIAVTACDMRSA